MCGGICYFLSKRFRRNQKSPSKAGNRHCQGYLPAVVKLCIWFQKPTKPTSTWIISIAQFESIWLFCWHPWTPFWSGHSNWGSGEGWEGSKIEKQNLLHSKLSNSSVIQSTLLCLLSRLSLCVWGASVRCCVDGLRVISLSGKRARTCSFCDVELLASICLWPHPVNCFMYFSPDFKL